MVVAVGLALLATPGILRAWIGSVPAGGAPRVTASAAGWQRLPVAEREALSRAVGRELLRFHVRAVGALAMQARSAGLSFTFGAAGVDVAAGSRLALRLGLSAVGRGGVWCRVGSVTPRRAANTVKYRHPGIAEWYANGPLGLEQGFTIAARPKGAGELTLVAGGIAAGARAHLAAEGSSLEVSAGSSASVVSYHDLEVTDARGRRLQARIGLRGRRVLLWIDDAGARYPLTIDPLVEQAEFSGGADGMLGFASAISGSTVVVGAPGTKVGSNAGQGAVFVYTATASGGWQQSAELTASDGVANDNLGSAVAIDGNTIVAGAPFHAVAGNADEGAIYVFIEPPSGGWQSATQDAELTASDGAADDAFGSSVGISGSTIVAGAPFHAFDGSAGRGSIYAFTQPPSGRWQDATSTELVASDGAANDNFGSSAAVFASTIVAGAPGHMVGSNSGQGAAYVFTEASGAWSNGNQAELAASDGAANDNYGAAVALSNSTLVVGAPDHAVGSAAGEGAAYVYAETSGAAWQQAAELTATGAGAGDGLGTSVAISGEMIVAGAPHHAVGQVQYAGEAYVFTEPSSGGWPDATQSGATAADGAPNDDLGSSVGLSGSTVVASAPAHNAEAGALYIFGSGPSSNIPVNTQPPTINTTPLVGHKLSESHGTWTNNPIAYSYQWEDCNSTGIDCVPIPGASHQTYTLSPTDAGSTIVVQETAANLDGPSSPASSAPTTVVQSAPVITVPPSQTVVGSSGASFTGTVNPGGLQTAAYFEYGLDPKYDGGGPVVYDQSTARVAVGSDFVPHSVSASVTGLVPNALYHVRLVASNSAAIKDGPDQAFTTGPTTPPTAPVIGQSVNLTLVSGVVLVKTPSSATESMDRAFSGDALVKGAGFEPLTESRKVPLGSQIDARRGTLRLDAATGSKGKLQFATLRGGIIGLTQSRNGLTKGLTTFSLLEGDFPGAPSYASCPRAAGDKPARAHATRASPRVLQTLRASDNHGKFRTKGRYSSATVRGTEWETIDRCDGTLTVVQRGTVDVYDNGTRKTITVHAGHSYLAKAVTPPNHNK